MEKFFIRRAIIDDVESITNLFHDTVLHVNAKDYSPEQIKVWLKSADNKERWLNKILQQYFIVAIVDDSIVGFASITSDGYLDFMYVSKDHQQKNIATKLLSELESYANENRISTIISDVSVTAKPFYLKSGFELIKEQSVKIEGIELINYRVEKQLK